MGLMHISRMAPEVATPRVVARTAGLLTAMGGVAAVGLALGTPGGLDSVHPAVTALGPFTTLLGLAVIRWGHRVPRGFFQVLLLLGVVGIGVYAHSAPTANGAVAVLALSTFSAMVAFLFFPLLWALGFLAEMLVIGTVVVVLRGDVPVGTAVVLAVLVLGSAGAVGVLARRAASAGQDALTGLVNRRGFDESLDGAVRTALRTGEPLSAALFDLDHFKAVNDSQGHAAGDEMLRAVAAAWQPLLPRGAVLARHGGDEFSLLLPGTDGGRALAVAESLRAALPSIGTSVGVAQLAPGDAPSDLMRRADAALYRVKSLGRGRSELDTEGQSPLARDLAAALAAGRSGGLSVHLQPVVTPADGGVVGVEALVRWVHPGRGPVPPSEFVPVAEREGLVGALGAFVWTAACEDARTLSAATGRPLILSVNVSGLELDDPGFPDRVLATLAATGWPAERTVVEVTETLVEAETARSVRALRELRAHGLRVAIDDFGTGYSALARLDTLPTDYLKLDGSFVSAITTSTRRARLLRSVMALADSLDLVVVAEGVETEEQARALATLGCPLAQGHLFGRPRPVAELAAELAPLAQPA
ncbi:bifunctional diguanylate cyclase/phosphodiesterase [Blastococcus sp. MG754426]|uniref:putative bifunctional diguanylate cyclase/phosphodiesterase n=1 Tax=unclassified Blastococcus TaxID=2619396 RepID=UPI001EEF8AF0|nr:MULTISPECIES: bifunctional diguanylate cyclase/phosphodiesterase [unclassified Blastococcus]MCF6509447.1 bifunctional diguanylate cyclase/phosphodiesterase [Blastococcus sp. MG754426]MCF6513515.1 bifunctional diguanylate cyclase/phosphodiesterase [Blastococcus sp. MG754427]